MYAIRRTNPIGAKNPIFFRISSRKSTLSSSQQPESGSRRCEEDSRWGIQNLSLLYSRSSGTTEMPSDPSLAPCVQRAKRLLCCLIITHDGREVRATTRVKWNLSLCVDRQEFRRWRPWPSTSGSGKTDWVWVGKLRTQHSKERSGKDEGTWLLGTIYGWRSQC